MSQVVKLIELMLMFGMHAGALAFATASIWSALVHPASRTAILIWLIGAVLNVPFLILSIRIVAAGQNFTPGSEHALMNLVVFYWIGALGLGWLVGIIFGSLIRVLVAIESPQRT